MWLLALGALHLLLSLAHNLSQAHDYCAVHRQFEDARAVTERPAAPPDSATHESVQQEHEACAFEHGPPPPLPTYAVPGPVGLAAHAELIVAALPPAPPAPIPLLALAPKSSPPRA